LGKKFYNSLKIGPNFFLQHFKNKIIYNFVKLVATKKGMTINFFHTTHFFAVFGSGVRNPGSGMGNKKHDPDSKVRDKHPGSATLIVDKDTLVGGYAEREWQAVRLSGRQAGRNAAVMQAGSHACS
jgi:hypothetical protein